MLPVAIPNKQLVLTYKEWKSVLKKWTQTKDQDLRRQLFALRDKAYTLLFPNNVRFHVWAPTVDSLMVIPDECGCEYVYKCFNPDATFDIVMNSNHTIKHLVIDIIDNLGETRYAEKIFKTLISFGEEIGVDVLFYDHASTCGVSTTFLNLLNNQYSFPTQYGFFPRNTDPERIKDIVYHWRMKHQTQLLHFVKDNGKINLERSNELSSFLNDHLTENIRTYIHKITHHEYYRIPSAYKQSTFNDLCVQ